ncbi:MAG: YicC family protein [Calditrichia bacterium]|nr:YicC family protein [Calditrichia bacterium]
MPRSMTGFGRAEIKNSRFEITVEIRSLNNRFLDIGLKLPKSLNPYEYILKGLTKKKILRGKLTAVVNFKNLVLENGDLRLNQETVQFYHQLLEKIKSQTGIKDEITLDHLLQFKEFIEPEEAVFQDDEIKKVLTDAFDKALENLDAMRRQEAENICVDIYSRLKKIKTALNSITEKAKNSPRLELDKLYNRLQERINNKEVDKDRLELELAIIADRVDVTEECIRLSSHLDLFKDVLDNKDEVGKQLTFLLQEMHRETNTIGSKTSDISISHEMIRLKEEIEKLREQIQNLE